MGQNHCVLFILCDSSVFSVVRRRNLGRNRCLTMENDPLTEKILPIHEAQILAYQKLSGIGTGLLINFNALPLKSGIKRFVV